jgi:hypothetical protein
MALPLLAAEVMASSQPSIPRGLWRAVWEQVRKGVRSRFHSLNVKAREVVRSGIRRRRWNWALIQHDVERTASCSCRGGASNEQQGQADAQEKQAARNKRRGQVFKFQFWLCE